MRIDLARIVEALVAATPPGCEVTLDAIGDALGVLAVDAQEIDAMIAAIEATGRSVGSGEKASGTERLRAVLATATTLRVELGRTPSPREVAERANMTIEAVRRALALAKVMQR